MPIPSTVAHKVNSFQEKSPRFLTIFDFLVSFPIPFLPVGCPLNSHANRHCLETTRHFAKWLQLLLCARGNLHHWPSRLVQTHVRILFFFLVDNRHRQDCLLGLTNFFRVCALPVDCPDPLLCPLCVCEPTEISLSLHALNDSFVVILSMKISVTNCWLHACVCVWKSSTFNWFFDKSRWMGERERKMGWEERGLCVWTRDRPSVTMSNGRRLTFN